MEAKAGDDAVPVGCNVKATFRLGSEMYCVEGRKGFTMSEQLASMKEESMGVLKEFITKHNVPNDVPDELVESGSDDDDNEGIPEKPLQVKSKKTKLT